MQSTLSTYRLFASVSPLKVCFLDKVQYISVLISFFSGVVLMRKAQLIYSTYRSLFFKSLTLLYYLNVDSVLLNDNRKICMVYFSHNVSLSPIQCEAGGKLNCFGMRSYANLSFNLFWEFISSAFVSCKKDFRASLLCADASLTKGKSLLGKSSPFLTQPSYSASQKCAIKLQKTMKHNIIKCVNNLPALLPLLVFSNK